MMRTATISAVLIALVLAFSGIFENEAMYGRIHADAQGYYGYLVAVFLEQSFDWQKVIHSYSDVYFNGSGADFTVTGDFGRINKYYVGTAVLMLPFFVLSCLAAMLFGFPMDGYSEPFQTGVVFGALFYAGLGIYFLMRFLKDRGISEKVATATGLLYLFATPLFHYSISEPAMSHTYSFAMVSVFMFAVNRWLGKPSKKQLVTASIALALIVLIRPVNGLVLLSVPFLAGGFRQMLQKLTAQKKLASSIAIALFIGLVVVSLQSLAYLAQVGKPVVWSYQGEGFNFADPEVFNVLFSYRKGVFVYTPLALLGLVGIILYTIKKPREGFWLLGFLTAVVYVISSWWNWYYGGSLGMRAMIEYLPFFAFGTAFLFQSFNTPARIGLGILSVAFVGINLVQSYQYQKFILHWDSMNKERFWQVFLKTDRQYDGIFYRTEKKGIELPADELVTDRVVFSSDFELLNEWGPQGINSERAFSGTQSTKVNADEPYGSTLGVTASELGPEGTKMLHVTAQVWSEEAFPELTIAYSYRGAEGDYGHAYIGFDAQIDKPEQWIEVELLATLSEPKDSTDSWIVYPHNPSSINVYLDDVSYEIITLK